MGENQSEIDDLLAEMNSLAEDATEAPAAVATAPSASPAKPAPSSQAASGASPAAGSAAHGVELQRVLRIQVPIIVQLAEREMPLSSILNMNIGSIIEFEKPFDAPLELRINNKCIGIGQAVKVGENFGLRVTRVGSVQHRIKALGEK